MDRRPARPGASTRSALDPGSVDGVRRMSVGVTAGPLASGARDDVLVARNPATGQERGRLRATSPEDVAGSVDRARRAQAEWAALNWSHRRWVLDRWRRILSRDAEEWAELVGTEIGKPRIEAMGGDVVPALDAIRWTILHGGE